MHNMELAKKRSSLIDYKNPNEDVKIFLSEVLEHQERIQKEKEKEEFELKNLTASGVELTEED